MLGKLFFVIINVDITWLSHSLTYSATQALPSQLWVFTFFWCCEENDLF